MRRRKPELIDVTMEQIDAIIARSEEGPLNAEDREVLKKVVKSLFWLQSELENTSTTLAYIRKILSINTKKTEKTREVLKGVGDAEQSPGDPDEPGGEEPGGEGPGHGGEEPVHGGEEPEKKKKKKKKGHGRNGADAYTGAEKISVPHESLKAGDPCPECEKVDLKGKLYQQKPSPLVRLRGQAPISGTVWELERLRCSLCGKMFTATPPEDAKGKRYDETSAVIIALLRYGSGLPFNRLARLEGSLGFPLSVSTQWDIVKAVAAIIAPVYAALTQQAAQGEIIYHDDTPMKILTLLKENQRIEAEGSKERTGIFTSGLLAVLKDRKIVLFFTGRQHCGENLEDVLEKRSSDLDPPIQMCDGSSRNEPEAETLVANGRNRLPAL